MSKQENGGDQEYKARSVALRLLARREHSRQELAMKLRQRKLDSSVISAVLDEYEDKGWLDDNRFAEEYSRQRIASGYGPVRVQAELQQRGIHHTPECVSESVDADWIHRALLLREKRFGLSDLSSDRDEKMRQARFLTRRGFTANQVERALEVRDAIDPGI
ncbi:regulatory protein RecX [Streptosporangium jomthongense]|uniref:Regulatory protein RecX n=1 Tax=Marinobacter aromaticivorans TaxID=1494078 RepID=A0ABW2IZY1_9GAMM|nr:regulatory protein RecX [Marinobacter aromaticivorans]GGE78998.1 regulatory protein RecX [Streptosporangium jomthongense]